MAINYQEQVWVDGTDTYTPLSPDRMNHMEAGIKAACDGWDSVSQFPTFEAGRRSAIEAVANTTTSVHVAFGKTFPKTPIVVATFSTPSTNATYGQMTVSAVNVSTTGFDIFVHNSGAAKTPSVSWLAVA